MELAQFINGKRILVRRCNSTPSRRVAVISHGRFLPLQALFGGMSMDTRVPAGVAVNWYVRHGETISNHTVMGLYERLHRGDSPVSIKDYSGRNTVKNYILRADISLGRSCTSRSGGHCDVILPVDIITTQNILEAIQAGQLPYHEVYFLSCRANRLTQTNI
ncbi:putative adhesin [Yersinia sp. Marseille-Q3913]|uniref:putative adhesin n=1 Tax=Yersinia sp. Marseille-Q3913 TaxID=2830769 RepID=UPI0030D8B7CF